MLKEIVQIMRDNRQLTVLEGDDTYVISLTEYKPDNYTEVEKVISFMTTLPELIGVVQILERRLKWQ